MVLAPAIAIGLENLTQTLSTSKWFSLLTFEAKSRHFHAKRYTDQDTSTDESKGITWSAFIGTSLGNDENNPFCILHNKSFPIKLAKLKSHKTQAPKKILLNAATPKMESMIVHPENYNWILNVTILRKPIYEQVGKRYNEVPCGNNDFLNEI